MPSPIPLAVIAFVVSVLFTPLLRDFASRRGWLDHPDSHRKKHQRPIPRIGGVPIVLAYVAALGTPVLFNFHTRVVSQSAIALISVLLSASVLVFATGLLDDLVSLTPLQKVVGQTIAASLACLGGIHVNNLEGISLSAYVGVPLTILWIVGCSNAFNLIDGLDGLAAGLGCLGALTMLGAGLFTHDHGLEITTAPLAAALVGFLLFNSYPASIFLGDCGSLWVGFMLACYGVMWTQRDQSAGGIMVYL